MSNNQMNEEYFVSVPLDRYEELIITEQKYKLLIEAALTEASLCSWNKEVDLNTGAVEAAIKCFEPARVLFVKNELMKQQKELVEENCMEVKA